MATNRRKKKKIPIRQESQAEADEAKDADGGDGSEAPELRVVEPAAEASPADAESPAEGSEDDRIRALEADVERYLDMAKRARAELENYRRRKERELADLKRASLADFLKAFFPALDDLDRAVAEGEKQHDYETLHTGVKLVRDNLWKVLEKEGVEIIEAEGQKFDPNVHEAMTAVPAPDHEPNTVLEVFQPGYRMNDFVLRPAKVVVAAAPV